MAYDKFNILNSSAVPLNIDNVDTDQIIPARFLKATERKGFGENLFKDWRYNSNDTPIDSFPLNNKIYNGKILVAGKNFGCGSSREHAPQAIKRAGFNAIIGQSFAEIFSGNCKALGIVTVTLERSILDGLFDYVNQFSQDEFRLDLSKQELNVAGKNDPISFKMKSKESSTVRVAEVKIIELNFL